MCPGSVFAVCHFPWYLGLVAVFPPHSALNSLKKGVYSILYLQCFQLRAAIAVTIYLTSRPIDRPGMSMVPLKKMLGRRKELYETRGTGYQ